MILLKPDRDRCERCRSAMDKAGYQVIDDRQGTGQERRFLWLEHLHAALREGLIPLRVVGAES